MKEQFIELDLQFFSAEDEGRTEKATSKKREDARKKGQVAKSAELNTAVLIVGSCAGLKIFGGYMYERLLEVIKSSFLQVSQFESAGDAHYLSIIIVEAIWSLLMITFPLWAILFVAALVISIMQVGYKIALEPLQPKFSKMNPISGLKRIISKDTLVTLVLSTAKVSILGTIVYKIIVSKIPVFLKLYELSLEQIVLLICSTVLQIGFTVGGAFLGLSILDYVYQRYKHEEGIKMTKQEVKEEYKNAEGDPQVKSKMKQKMREASMRRMMQSIPDADVIITNPTHFAVAIKYDGNRDVAPIVVAKGVDYVAKKIKEKAKEHHIQIIENRPLARALYYTVDLDREIPPELYNAVAEVLAFVYGLDEKNKNRRR